MSRLCLFLFLLWSTLSMAAENAAQALNQKLSSFHTIRAKFIQNTVDEHQKVIQRAKGQMVLQRPGQLRWETEAPIAQVIVVDGQKIWIYDPDLEQVTIRLLDAQASELPALLLSRTTSNVSHYYDVQWVPHQTLQDTFLLRPKNKNSVMTAVRLRFQGNTLREMQLQDHLGHMTSIVFNNVQMNRPIPATLFKFKIPPHVDVIDETKYRRSGE